MPFGLCGLEFAMAALVAAFVAAGFGTLSFVVIFLQFLAL